MKIEMNKIFEMNNLVSRAGRFTQNVYQSELLELLNSYKKYTLNQGDCLITTTKSVEYINGEQVLNVEMLMPVSKVMTVNNPYIFKDNIKIYNAIYSKIEDNALIQDNLNEINDYIYQNGLQPITSAYLVQKKEEFKTSIEVYIGLSPNIL